MAARLEGSGLCKRFPGVVALEVQCGEIRALLGENGAGKSTLGKAAAGVYRPDDGAVTLDGVPLRDLDEAAAGALVVGIVHQEGSLIRQLSVAENVFSGRQPTGRLGAIDRRTMRARTRELLDTLGVAIDPATPVRDLSPAQVVEIAKALSRDLRLLILDEPAAALTLAETQRLFAVVRRLAAAGVAVVYVSHRLAEIFELCHRVTVLRDGRVTGTREVAATDKDELIRLMVGCDVAFARVPPRPRVERLLEVRGLVAPPFVSGADLDLHAGEIVCLAGLMGFGPDGAVRGGLRRPAARGGHGPGPRPARPLPGASDAMAAGLGMVPEGRKDAGLFLAMDLAANIGVTVLGQLSPGSVVAERRAIELARRFMGELRIAAPSPRTAVGALSGGNQQKVLLAKWLAREPEVPIVDEPTRGVDVGARAEIYRILRDLAAKGVGLLVVSSDLPEVLTPADRIVVMAEGRTAGELPGEGASEEAVLRLATLSTTAAPGNLAA